MSYKEFEIKLKDGQYWEEQAFKRPYFKNVKLVLKQGRDNYKKIHYDFKTDDGIKYEVKADHLSKITGNIFVEYLDGRGKISGITLSTADFYIFYTHDIFILIDIDKLKELTKGGEWRRGKDGTKGYIVKWELIRDAGTII